MISTKRIYEPCNNEDGYRVLVDRLWPRGVSKNQADIDLWLKDAAPSTSLRKWFNHDPEKWLEFKERYFVELNENTQILQPVLEALKRGTVTLLYTTRTKQYNHAIALKEYLTSIRE